jgi:hypothetical protein
MHKHYFFLFYIQKNIKAHNILIYSNIFLVFKLKSCLYFSKKEFERKKNFAKTNKTDNFAEKSHSVCRMKNVQTIHTSGAVIKFH